MPLVSDKVERTCPHCGSVVTAEDLFCRACHTRFELRGAETDPTRMQNVPQGSVLNLRSPALSVLFSGALMGLGQFYNGDLVKGIIFNAAYLPVVFGFGVFPFHVPALAGIWILSLIDAGVTSWRINHLEKEYAGPNLLFWAGLALLIGLVAWYVVSGDALVFLRKLVPAAYFLTA